MKRYSIVGQAVLMIMTAFAQNCHAQLQNVTVQLPTYHVFGVSTTVVVPDRGAMVVGGVNRSSIGPYHHATSTGGISIGATIIDHDAMDRALLAEAARRRGARFDVLGRPVVAAARNQPLDQKTPNDIVGRRWTSSR